MYLVEGSFKLPDEVMASSPVVIKHLNLESAVPIAVAELPTRDLDLLPFRIGIILKFEQFQD